MNLIQAAAEESLPIAWGISARQGKRPTMEDAYASVLKFRSDDAQAFFAIYDGHVGAFAARAAAHGTALSKPLHTFLAESEADTLVERYKDAFQKIEEVLHILDDSGTTAITAHVNTKTKTITFAHVGDSRALLIQDDTIAATTDHKPSMPSEKNRIVAAGGIITQDGPIIRLNGAMYNMSVSRALGDRMQKRGIFKTKGLIATPEISTTSYTDDKNTILVLACDGVWDVVSNEEAAAAVATSLNNDPAEVISLLNDELEETTGNNDAAKYAAYTLRNLAYSKGSSDNISVMVAVLNKIAKPFATAITTEEAVTKLYDAAIDTSFLEKQRVLDSFWQE
jgi:protein phosphatase 2C family protein 2/3